jgi:TolB-like protein
VLPFANRTGDPQLDYLSDGIAEGVLHLLSRVGELHVLARSTTFRYRDASDPVAVGAELKVRAVLTGEVSLRRGSVAVSAELIDVKSGAHLWGGSYPDAQAQSVEETIAREAGASLDSRAVVQARQKAVNDEAYRLYLRGRHSLNKWTSESLRSAIRSFEEAIDREPSFALGFAGLADAYVVSELQSEPLTIGSLGKARAAARRALQIDDSIEEAHTSLAVADFKGWNWEAAERGFQRAIALNPNYETAYYWYGIDLVTRGRIAEALEKMERAHEIDPFSAPIAAHRAICKALTGRVDEAIRELKALALSAPDTPLIHQWLASAYYLNHQMDLAIESAEREVASSNDGNVSLANLAFLLSRNGRADGARAILQTLLERNDVRPFWLAGAYAGLGDVDHALQCLESGVYERDRGPETTYITWPPWFDDIKSEPRFIAILKHMGLAN